MRIHLGAYPDQAWYDPNRPSWLPYFIDDSAESAAKYGTTSLVGQMGGAAGTAVGDVGSAVGSAAGTFVGNALNAGVAAATGGDSSSTFSWSTIALIAAAGFLLIAIKK